MEYDIKTDKYGTTYYYKKGTNILHREDGPAIIFYSKYLGYIQWLIDGLRHRDNGPAVEMENGYKAWWINGKQLSPEKETILNKWWNKKNGI